MFEFLFPPQKIEDFRFPPCKYCPYPLSAKLGNPPHSGGLVSSSALVDMSRSPSGCWTSTLLISAHQEAHTNFQCGVPQVVTWALTRFTCHCSCSAESKSTTARVGEGGAPLHVISDSKKPSKWSTAQQYNMMTPQESTRSSHLFYSPHTRSVSTSLSSLSQYYGDALFNACFSHLKSQISSLPLLFSPTRSTTATSA